MNNKNLKITTASGMPILYSDVIPASWNDYLIKGAQVTYGYGAFGSFLLQVVETADVAIHFNNYLIEQDETFHFETNESAFELKFSLHNNLPFCHDGINDYEIHENHFNLIHTPFFNTGLKLRKGRRYSSFSIFCLLRYLKLFVGHHHKLKDFLSKEKVKLPVFFSQANHVTTSELKIIIRNILEAGYKGKLHNHFAEIKAKDILLMAIEELKQQRTPLSVRIHKPDEEKYYKAKELLLNNFDNPLSITEVAKIIGFSERKLTAGFHKVLGSPIYDCIITARMDRARKLLEETYDSISDIAYTVGYSSSNYFTKAFKKKYGYSPSNYRKSTL